MIYEKIDRPQMILGMHEFLKMNITGLELAVKSKDPTWIEATKENCENALVTASRVIGPIELKEYKDHYHKLLESVEE